MRSDDVIGRESAADNNCRPSAAMPTPLSAAAAAAAAGRSILHPQCPRVQTLNFLLTSGPLIRARI